MKKEAIFAVHDRDLEVFLSSIGILEKIKNKEIKCVECKSVITLENIGFIFPSKGRKIEICCDSPGCYYKMIGRRNKTG